MAPELDTFVALETEVWQALVDGDAQADERLLSADFVGVYPTGFATREDHVEQLDNAPSVTSFALSETRMMHVADDAVMLSYRSDFVRPPTAGQATGSNHIWYVSSLWRHRDDRWINTFSQDTPAAP